MKLLDTDRKLLKVLAGLTVAAAAVFLLLPEGSLERYAQAHTAVKARNAQNAEARAAEVLSSCAAARAKSGELHAQGVARPDEAAKVFEACEPVQAATKAAQPWLIGGILALLGLAFLPLLARGGLPATMR